MAALDPWYSSLRTAVQNQLLGDYVFSEICVSRVRETFPDIEFTWTEPVISGYTTGETYNLTLSVTADVNVCTRQVTFTAVLTGITKFQIISPKTMTRSTSVTEAVYEASRCPINGANQLCRCSSFSKSFEQTSGSVVVKQA